MPELISQVAAQEHYKQQVARRFEELVDKLNDEIPKFMVKGSTFTIPFMVPPDLQPLVRDLFRDSKDWALISLMGDNLVLQARILSEGTTDVE